MGQDFKNLLVYFRPVGNSSGERIGWWPKEGACVEKLVQLIVFFMDFYCGVFIISARLKQSEVRFDSVLLLKGG